MPCKQRKGGLQSAGPFFCMGEIMKLILIRHGETLWNKEKRLQGTSDIELSAVGIEQAGKLALSLKNVSIGAIHASPLKRAHQTAEIINRYHGKKIETHHELMEMNMGDFEGMPFKELMIREKELIDRWIAEPEWVRMPNGENLTDLQNRVWPSIQRIFDQGENALVVSHNFTIATILCRLRKLSLSAYREACVNNASKTVIHYQNNEVHIETVNDCRHLDGLSTP